MEAAASAPLFPNAEAAAILASEPTFPHLASDLWASYIALHVRRGRDMDGPLRFTWSEIQAYCNLTGVCFEPWHLDALFLIEDEYFAVRAANMSKDKPTKPNKNKGSKELA